MTNRKAFTLIELLVVIAIVALLMPILKELWKLKWRRNFDANGRWTSAGGCGPDDWPEWMRRFKDY